MRAYDGRLVVLALRVAQAVFALIVLGLTGYVANWWVEYWHRSPSPSPVKFLVFCAAWTLLALLYLTLVPWRFSDTAAHHPSALLAVEGATMLFWFAGFIALAVFLSDRVCFGGVCAAAQAACVLAAFTWAAFAATAAMAVRHLCGSRAPPRPPRAAPNPTMQEGG